jgi:hydrogenase nickel incorporation protein HypA/HybF
MHELSLCQAVIRQASQIATENGTTQIHQIQLCIGPLSGAEPELMQQAFPFASRGTVAEDAILNIEASSVQIHCPECQQQSQAKTNKLDCPHCGNWQTTLLSGDEMLLVSVDLASAHLNKAEKQHV